MGKSEGPTNSQNYVDIDLNEEIPDGEDSCMLSAEVPDLKDPSGSGGRNDLQKLMELLNGDSIGNHLKQARDVMKKRTEVYKSKQPNVNCRIERFGSIVEKFNLTKRRLVDEMGFGNLLYLTNRKLPRSLCYWLMTRVDPIKRVFVACDGKEFNLSKQQVHWVYGIPHGPNQVPGEIDDEMRNEVSQMWCKYGSTHRSISHGIRCKSIDLKRVEKTIEDPVSDPGDFKRAFLIFALGTILCPTTGCNLAVDLIPAVTVWKESGTYDWCSFVLEKLFESCESFCTRFYENGYAAGCGGSTYFLAIFYLDRLNRNAVEWRVKPRIKVWNEAETKKAIERDRDACGGDFGLLGCLEVPYGHKHPKDTQDSMLHSVEEEACLSILKSFTNLNLQHVIPSVLNSIDISDRLDSVHYTHGIFGQPVITELEPWRQEMVPKRGRSVRTRMPVRYSIRNISWLCSYSLEYLRSLSRERFAVSDDARHLLVEYIYLVGKHQKDNKIQRNAEILLQCGNDSATLSCCYDVLYGPNCLDVEYVRACGSLLNANWSKKSNWITSPCILFPSFAEVALRVEGFIGNSPLNQLLEDCCVYIQKMNRPTITKFFVPVCESGHWWAMCVCVSRISSKIFIIDSRNGGRHQRDDCLGKLLFVLDYLMLKLDPRWTVGTVNVWPIFAIQNDDVDVDERCRCGVRMLSAIKNIAFVEPAEWGNLGGIFESCSAKLVVDDILSIENEALCRVQNMVLSE